MVKAGNSAKNFRLPGFSFLGAVFQEHRIGVIEDADEISVVESRFEGTGRWPNVQLRSYAA